MKTKNLLKKLATVIVGLSMVIGANALTKTTALTLSDLQTQFAAANVAGVRDTINIGAAITVNVDLSLVATGDTIIINMAPYGISVTAGTLSIGNKVKVVSALATAGALQANGGNIVLYSGCFITTSTANTLQALANSTITINGGTVTSTATSPVVAAGGNVIINGGKVFTNNYPAIASGMAINTVATGGTVTVNGGLVYTTATGIARGIVVDYNGVCIVNGGEVRSDMGGGRGISINSTNAGGKLTVNGGIVSATGATGRAIQLDNLNSTLWVTGGTITGGLEGIMVQKNGVAVLVGSPTITGTIGTNTTTSKLYDARGLSTPVATPGQGYYAASQSVTVTGGTGTIYKYSNTTAQASATTVTSSLVYTTDGTDPVAVSTAVSAPITMAIPSTLKVAALIEGTTVSPNVAFGYWTIGTPMTAAPTPPARPAPKVTSIFSDAYPNVANSDLNPNWGQTGSDVIVQVAGNNTLKMTPLNYQGIQFGSPVNALPMNYLHVDMFTSNETSITISCISAATPANKEFAVALTPITLNAWGSYDIPLSSFTGVDMSNLIQFKFVGSGGKTVYVDNLYFYQSDPTPDTQAPTAFTAVKGAVLADAVTLTLTGTDNSGAVYYDITYGTTTVTASGVSGVTKSFQISGLTGTTNYSFSVVCRDATGNVAANSPIVVTATTLTPLPGAPVPTRLAANVISIFSDTYTSVAGTNFNPGWGQTTVESLVQLSNNNTIKYANLNYQGIALAANVNASTMTKLHVDIYPLDETSLQITPISPATPANKEHSLALTPLVLNQWNSYDLLLTGFTGVDMSQVFQFKFTGSGGKTVYMDNLYFFSDANGIAAVAANDVFKCFPSQVTTNVKVTAETEISTVTVHNLVGQSVKSVVVNSNEKSIDLSAVAAGNYFVTVRLANGQSATQKIIKL